MNDESVPSAPTTSDLAGAELDLLHQAARAAVKNGGDWYTPGQMLQILGEFVGRPALMVDAAFIGMATPERIASLLERDRAQTIEVAIEGIGRVNLLVVDERGKRVANMSSLTVADIARRATTPLSRARLLDVAASLDRLRHLSTGTLRVLYEEAATAVERVAEQDPRLTAVPAAAAGEAHDT
jgi:hypothetical protein